MDQQEISSKLSLVLQRSFNQQPLTCVAENPRIASRLKRLQHHQQHHNSNDNNNNNNHQQQPLPAGPQAAAASSFAAKSTTLKLDVHCK